MKPGGVSTLNPYAAAYIPLSKRGVAAAAVIGTDDDDKAARVSYVPELSTKKGGQSSAAAAHGYYGSSSWHSSSEPVKKQVVVNEEFEMDLEYLQVMFPGISNESLTDVYLANKGDLGATIDMLNDLEFDTLESSENLPDTLDIGDVSESGSTAEFSSLKLKSVSGEVGACSSGSSAPDKVTVS